MYTKDLKRRSLLKMASSLALAPALPLIPLTARAADNDVVVGTWGGDYQNLLQQFIAPSMSKAGVNVVYDTGNAVARVTKLKAEHASRRGSMDVALLGDLDMYEAYRGEALTSPGRQAGSQPGQCLRPVPHSVFDSAHLQRHGDRLQQGQVQDKAGFVQYRNGPCLQGPYRFLRHPVQLQYPVRRPRREAAAPTASTRA